MSGIQNCPCGSGQPYAQCCQPCHSGTAAASAQALMHSRYCAYVLGLIDYLVATTLPVQQLALDRAAISAWSSQSSWLGLEVEHAEILDGQPAHAWVIFVARWRDGEGTHAHRERSAFVQHRGRWYFIDPTVALNAGRNDPCPCGSAVKFKKCCAGFIE